MYLDRFSKKNTITVNCPLSTVHSARQCGKTNHTEVSMLHRFIGDRAFYKKVLSVALPIIIQNGITQFVSLLDNIMVGAVGELPMSGVAIANQLIFVANICVFGANSGAGIFTAQYHGNRDHKGVRHTFRFKLLACFAVTVLTLGVFLLWGRPLLNAFLQGEGDPREAALTLGYGMEYLKIMLLGLLPFAITNAYNTTLRECGQTVVPMVGGVAAVLTNLFFNWVLIFGHFGVPAMGVRGAALATVISRYVELAIAVIWTHTHGAQHPFIRGTYRSARIPKELLLRIARRGTPLMCNEVAWAVGMAFLSQCYSYCGLAVVPATNIASVIRNLSAVVHMAMGSAVGILMGQLMGSGAGEEQVRSTNRKLLAISVSAGVFFGILLAAAAPLFPQLYKVSPEVRTLASQLILVHALVMPFNAYTHSVYFTLRSGGRTGITFLFDSGYVCCVLAPVAFVLSRFSPLSIVPIYLISQGTEIPKAFLGLGLLKKIKWIRNLAAE